MENICKKCGSIGETLSIVDGENGPHYGRVICKNCGTFIKWLPKPNGHKLKCKQKLDAALHDKPNNQFYQSLKKFFEQHGTLTPAQFNALNKY